MPLYYTPTSIFNILFRLAPWPRLDATAAQLNVRSGIPSLVVGPLTPESMGDGGTIAIREREGPDIRSDASCLSLNRAKLLITF